MSSIEINYLYKCYRVSAHQIDICRNLCVYIYTYMLRA